MDCKRPAHNSSSNNLGARHLAIRHLQHRSDTSGARASIFAFHTFLISSQPGKRAASFLTAVRAHNLAGVEILACMSASASRMDELDTKAQPSCLLAELLDPALDMPVLQDRLQTRAPPSHAAPHEPHYYSAPPPPAAPPTERLHKPVPVEEGIVA
ncbi:hypothetical protein DFH09DRAFT_1310012 [Mycena vulgaris]|nr:hypothetical protein DFH09DRAFT_1310012 [Mycena vulgaris]